MGGRRVTQVWPVPLYTGVSLVGSSVQNNNGILSGFTSSSYAKMPFYWTSGASQIEAVIKVTTSSDPQTIGGIWGCVGSTDAFTPFYQSDVSGVYKFTAWISSNGSSWNVNDGGFSSRIIYADATANSTFVMKIVFDGTGYTPFLWTSGAWTNKGKLTSTASPYGTSSLEMELGTNWGQNNPFLGTIDLNYTYLYRDGQLWWEGAAGAYRNVKTEYPDA
jgi:hypothetical protein